MATKKAQEQDDNVEVILEQPCKTVSGKSELILNLGRDANNQLMIRIKSNSGSGQFSDRWVPIPELLEKLKSADSILGFTSVILSSVTRGRSANDPGFLAAALKSLGILLPMEGKQRRYVLGDVDAFLSKMKLLQSGEKANQKTTTKKPAAKTKAKSPRKSPASSRKTK